MCIPFAALAADPSSVPAPPALPAPPAPPAPPAAPRPDLDKQLEAAQKRLEQAASEVARLSTQLSSHVVEQVMPTLGMGHGIIGVQLEPVADGVGARVKEVSPGGPAAEAGIRTGDVIVALNGTDLKGPEPAREAVRVLHDVKPDSHVSVRVLRDGKTRDFTVTARAAPELFAGRDMPYFNFDFSDFPDFSDALARRSLMDMELATLTPRLGSYFGSDKGVLVVRAPANGALQLEDGDVILAIDGREPTSGSHATRILRSYQPGEKLTLRIIRQRKTLQLEETVPEPAPRRDGARHAGPTPDSGHSTRTAVIVGNDRA
ncbi:MAG TPA: PDZ domain-containing protein [Steroidobacteraceae bacterium]|jgi:S1-C subfamily serine protease|nr:PDZ domain-containing protein [Steroidobacteraceae bacterium]